jgi:hypothetical protein
VAASADYHQYRGWSGVVALGYPHGADRHHAFLRCRVPQGVVVVGTQAVYRFRRRPGSDRGGTKQYGHGLDGGLVRRPGVDRGDRWHETIKLYLTKLSKAELDAQESARNIEILSFTTNLEHIGDIIDNNLMELANKKIKGRLNFSDEGLAELRAFHEHVLANLDLARRLLRQKTATRDLEPEFVENHYARIGQERPESIESSALHLDVLRDLKRISSHLTSVAYPILDRAGELAESRLLEADN